MWVQLNSNKNKKDAEDTYNILKHMQFHIPLRNDLYEFKKKKRLHKQ